MGAQVTEGCFSHSRRFRVTCRSPVLECVSLLTVDGLLQVAQASVADTFDEEEYRSHHKIYRQTIVDY